MSGPVLQKTSVPSSVSERVTTILRANAPPFQPSRSRASSTGSCPPPSQQVPPEMEGKLPNEIATAASEACPATATVELPSPQRSKSQLPARSAESFLLGKKFLHHAGRAASGALVVAGRGHKSVPGKGKSATSQQGLDLLDEQVHAELTTASERVWAEAEAWVDAEAAAEENEWKIMGLAGSGPGQPLAARSLDGPLVHKHPNLAEQRKLGNGDLSEVRKAISADARLVIDTELSSTPMRHPTKRSPVVVLRFSPTMESVAAGSAFSFRSAGSGKTESPANQILPATTSPNTSLGTVFSSGGRSLHQKLSSPDRKRDLSPTEALRIHGEGPFPPLTLSIDEMRCDDFCTQRLVRWLQSRIETRAWRRRFRRP